MKLLLSRQDKAFPGDLFAAKLVKLSLARGADVNKLLSGTGIFDADLISGQRVSLRQLYSLTENALQQVKGNDLSFQFGRSLLETDYHPAMSLFMHSRNFKQILDTLSVLRVSIFPFVSACGVRNSDFQTLLLQDAGGNGKLHQFFIEAYCSALVALAKRCVGRRLTIYFNFSFARPRHIQEYETNLGYRLRFSQPLDTIEIPNVELFQPCRQANINTRKIMLDQCLAQRQYRLTFVDEIRRLMRRQPSISQPEVAMCLGMSTASLKRKLQENNTTFSCVYDDIRRQQAIYYLQVKKLNNEQSAVKLAFTDLTNFRRAVKRWTGCTPSQLRKA
jgi:AraC-like DNA-binding protein